MGIGATMPPVASSLFDKSDNAYASTLLGSKRKFGYDFFTKTPSSYAPLIDLPIPNTYQINPGEGAFYQIAQSVIRAIRLCNPIKNLPTVSYEKWKTMILRFNPVEMMGG